MTKDFFDLMGCIQENRIKTVRLWGHETIQSDVTIRFVDCEQIDSDAFSENENAISGAAMKMVIVAVIIENECIDVGPMVIWDGMKLD